MNETEIIELLKSQYVARDTTNFNLLDFVAAIGTPLDVLMYSGLFWPSFEVYREMVFLKSILEDNNDREVIDLAFEKYKGDRLLTEKSFNLIEIPSGIFNRGIEDCTDKQAELLAHLLREIWSVRLKLVFPKRDFNVEFLTQEETGGEIAIIFYQRPVQHEGRNPNE
jgi:hypothetical protein